MPRKGTIVILEEQPLPITQRLEPMAGDVELSPGSCRDAAPKLHLTLNIVINSSEEKTAHQLEEDRLIHNGINLPVEEPAPLPFL